MVGRAQSGGEGTEWWLVVAGWLVKQKDRCKSWR